MDVFLCISSHCIALNALYQSSRTNFLASLTPLTDSVLQGEVELRGEEVVLGRAAGLPAVCTFKDRRISSRHCRIYRDAEQRIWVEDLSVNGTYVNGGRVGKGKKRQMQIGDLLGLATLERQAKKDERTLIVLLLYLCVSLCHCETLFHRICLANTHPIFVRIISLPCLRPRDAQDPSWRVGCHRARCGRFYAGRFFISAVARGTASSEAVEGG